MQQEVFERRLLVALACRVARIELSVISRCHRREANAVAVGGATSNPNASLVIKDGELYCLDAAEMPTFTQVIEEYEDSRARDGPTTTAEFLAETDTDIEAQAFDEEEDTPDVDQI